MRPGSYIKDHMYHILFWTAGIFLADGTVFLFDGSSVLIGFLTAIFAGTGGAVFYYDFSRKRKFYDDLLGKLDRLDEKYLVAEMLKEPGFLEGKILYSSYVDILKSMNDEIGRHERVSAEFRRYVETWIHQVKLPIASAELILHNHPDNPGETGRRLKEQLSRIEKDVEQVLYYIRSEVPQNDYSIAFCSLREIVEDTVRENKDSLILNQFSVSVDVGEEYVYTDRKWLAFMLGQIISNSVKYCREEQRLIRFYTEEDPRGNIILWSEDNGWGISSADLPRIFEKSFTGKNGRQISSTGMGLYICDRLCRELGHRIQAGSVEGEYTRIGIVFGPGDAGEKARETDRR